MATCSRFVPRQRAQPQVTRRWVVVSFEIVEGEKLERKVNVRTHAIVDEQHKLKYISPQ